MITGGAVTFNSGNFQFQITTTGANQTFTLPISGGGATYKQNFVAKWGDGNKSNITAYNSSSATHTYASAGTYIVELNGICEWFCFANAGDKTKVVALVSFTGDIGFKVLNFYGCINLATIIPFGPLNSLVTVANLFNHCTAIAAIPSGMFATCPNITDFSYVFAYCSNAGLTSLPADLFRYNTLVTNYSYAFYSCSNITAIPAGLLGSSVNASTSVMFTYTAITTVDVDAFRYFTGATTAFASIFGGSNIASVPADLFKYNVNVTSFSQTFSGTKLTLAGLPATIFRYNTAVTTFASCFANSYSLNALPAHLFDYNTAVTDFSSLITNCTAMSTALPAGLFQYNTAVTTFASAFNNVRFSSVPAGLFQYNTAVVSFASTFYGCNNLSTLPTDLFRYNTAVTSYNGTFQWCSSLHTLPAGLFGATSNADMGGIFGSATITTLTAGVFKYFTGATTAFASLFSSNSSITSLPVALFDYNTAVTSFNATFSGCSALATIPAGLFRLNTACTNFSYAMNYSAKLKLVSTMFYNDGEQATRFLNKSINFTQMFYRPSFTGVQGTAPDLWNCNFGTGTPLTSGCYGGAGNSLTSLTNYASIPTGWE